MAGITTLAELVVALGLDKREYDKNLKAAKEEAKSSAAQLKGDFLSAATAIGAGLGTIAAIGAAAYKKIIEPTIEFNAEIRKQKDLTGLSARELSKLTQVGDDWGIEAGAMTKIMEGLAKKGFKPSIDNLAKLADGYVGATDKTAFLQEATKKYGKQILELVPLLTKGGDELRKQTDAVNENQMATDESIKAAREFEENMDRLGDTLQGVTFTLGNALIPALNDLLTPLEQFRDDLPVITKETDEGTRYLQRHGQVLVDVTESYTGAGSAAEKFAKEDLLEVASSGDIASESLSNINIELGEITKNKIASESIKAINQSFKDGLIDNDTYEKLMYNVGRDMLNLPVGQIEASIAIAQLNKDFQDGKVEPADYLEIISGIYDKLKNMPTNLDIVINYRTSGNPGDVDLPVGERKPKAPKKPKPPHRKKQFGGDFIVPEGYPDDTYPYYFSTGEHVVVQRSTTNNFNMHINSSARREDIQTDFNLMRALAG